MSISIKLDKAEYTVTGTVATDLTVTGMSFTEFASLTASIRGADEKTIKRQQFRARIDQQVKATLVGGKVVKIPDEDIGRIPMVYVGPLKRAVDDALELDDDKSPEILSQGDGMVTPVHIKLAIPIQLGEGKAPIGELEFIAATLTQIEDVIVADGKLDAAIALLAIAKPVGPDLTLSTLPSWALSRISLVDGLFITGKVLDVFTGQSAEGAP